MFLFSFPFLLSFSDVPCPRGGVKKEKEKKHRSLFNFTWTKHIKETVAELYDDMNNEEV